MALRVPGRGNPESRIWIIGEAPGEEEELKGRPFVGASGYELSKMLGEAGINMDDCYIDNVCQWRPPGNDMSKWLHDKKATGKKNGDMLINGRWANKQVADGYAELQERLTTFKPEVIIGFGNTALWALAGKWGVMNWRGSELVLDNGTHFVPTIHPAAVLRDWSLRPTVMHDLSYRVARRLKSGFVTPAWNFKTFPSFGEVMGQLTWLENHPCDVAADIETMNGGTVCLGLAWSSRDALCIPFRDQAGVYWDADDQKEIIAQLVRTFKRCKLIGQNWQYDRQYLQENFGIDLQPAFDTFVAQSVLFPGTQRTLGYLASMYCDWHEYWKEDGKEWNQGIKDFNKEFRYNCRDACVTWEVGQVIRRKLEFADLMPQFMEQMEYGEYVYRMMRRGVTRSVERTERLIEECKEAVHHRKLAVAQAAGKEVNFNSPKQVSDLFYKQLGCKTHKKRGTDSLTTDDEALKKVCEENPDIAPIALAILESRSLDKLRSTFLEAECDPDGQFRASWMCPGTESFRLSSSTNAFYRGGNLQNITSGKHTHSGRKLPNLRATIVPPPGHGYFNVDLERADLQVVAWEANDDVLKRALRDHLDIHLMNARDLFGLPISDDEFLDPERVKYLADDKYEQQRHFAKSFVHGTNYGGKHRTMAVQCKCSVREAEDGQKRWFRAHPGILDWHNRTNAHLRASRTVTNRFGYRRVFFDRIDGVLPEALAWIPQSTVAIVIGRMHRAIENATEWGMKITMQGHDSLAGIYRLEHEEELFKRAYEASKTVVIPYSDPLHIPLELSTSLSSWGEVERRPWPIG